MTTTIQVSDTTKQLLEVIKKKERSRTYDKIIQELVKKHTKTAKSMFGMMKGWKWNKEEDRMKTRD